MFRKREPLITRTELNGLIVIFMRMDANVARIALEVAGGNDGEQA